MIYTINPIKDTTIYQADPTRNTGADQMLEIQKHTSTPTVDGIKNSRIIIGFDLTKFLLEGIEATKVDLQLWSANSNNISKGYIVEFSGVNDSDRLTWTMGTGLLIDNPAVTNGANWTKKDGSAAWSADYVSTSPLRSVTKSVADKSDINVDVTTIYTDQLSTSQLNMVIRRPLSEETSALDYGHIQYFSNETKTIYRPQLNLQWDDSAYTLGTNVVPTDDNIKVLAGSAKTVYTLGERNKITIKCIPMLKSTGYSTSSLSAGTQKVLPTTSYYKLTDVISGEDVYDYSTVGTKISCDASGSFIKLWTDTLTPEREYSLSVKVLDRGYSGRIEYFNEVYNFRVV